MRRVRVKAIGGPFGWFQLRSVDAWGCLCGFLQLENRLFTAEAFMHKTRHETHQINWLACWRPRSVKPSSCTSQQGLASSRNLVHARARTASPRLLECPLLHPPPPCPPILLRDIITGWRGAELTDSLPGAASSLKTTGVGWRGQKRRGRGAADLLGLSFCSGLVASFLPC